MDEARKNAMENMSPKLTTINVGRIVLVNTLVVLAKSHMPLMLFKGIN